MLVLFTITIIVLLFVYRTCKTGAMIVFLKLTCDHLFTGLRYLGERGQDQQRTD